jgi:hypothetical protein
MRLHEGMRRCLIAILMALALAFAAAGCGPPHVKPPVPRPHVPEQFRDVYDSDLNNLHKHAPGGEPTPGGEYTPGSEYTPADEYGQACYDDPYSYEC